MGLESCQQGQGTHLKPQTWEDCVTLDMHVPSRLVHRTLRWKAGHA